MKQLTCILLGCCLFLNTYSQKFPGLTGIRDTSFNLNSAYESIKKAHPEAVLVAVKNSPLVKVERNVTYSTNDKRKLLLDVFIPKRNDWRVRTAIIFLHGGGWRSGNRTMHHALAERLAELGYVVFTPEYRLSTEALYPAALDDVKAAIKWVRQNAGKYNFAANEIVVAGHSSGGQLAALAGATNELIFYEERTKGDHISSTVNAIIDIDGIVAFIDPDSGEGNDSKKISAATNWFGKSKTEKPYIWKDASPINHIGPHHPPILFINSAVNRMHAGRDAYRSMISEFNVLSEVRTFPDAPHVFPFFSPWFEPMVQTMDSFIKKIFIKWMPFVLKVSQDGNGDFKTVTEAINLTRSLPSPALIYIHKGIYNEKVSIDKSGVTLIGEDKFNTIISWNDHTGKVSPNGDTINTRTSSTLKITSPDFSARNITFQNDAGFSAGQAVAVESDGDKARFINCRFIGNQDVLFTNNDSSRQYFENCYIEGTTDFIFGSSTVWFEKCHIHSKKNSHITAASTPQQNQFGYVFNDCVLTGDTSLHGVSLGRPWRQYANVIYMNSYIGPHIKAEGWSNWNNTDNYLTTRYAEYNNYGPGANIESRVKWAKQLTAEASKGINLVSVFNGWNPK